MTYHHHYFVQAASTILLMLTPCCLSKMVVEEGAVKVVFPPLKNRFPMALANFGFPKYGGTLTGQLYYTNDTRCQPVPCNYACNFTSATGEQVVRIQKEKGKMYIMLVDLGPKEHPAIDCYFVQKVYNSQVAGADAVLVINSDDGDLSNMVLPKDKKAMSTVPLITISAALITKSDGYMLRRLMDTTGAVQVALNWTDVLPKQAQVSWELWTSALNECGVNCDVQVAFMQNISAMAIKLQQRNTTLFTPHYLLWSCPSAFSNTTECRTQCIAHGRYCVPDPDDDMAHGYSGRDVVLMNLHQLCFFRVASLSGQPWLWWNYAIKVMESCHMSLNSYTADCAEQVFKRVGGEELASGDGWQEWRTCIGSDASWDKDKPIGILEAEIAAHVGKNGQNSITIVPAVRINGHQYSGSLDMISVIRAICSAFPADKVPAECTSDIIDPDDCKPGGAGDVECSSSAHRATGTTKCINSFNGFTCGCKDGFTPATINGLQQCADINECTMASVMQADANCSCARCACENELGSYRCSGPLINHCTPEHDYGGCWQLTIHNRLYHACVDTISEYQANTALGFNSSQWYRCSCPMCFKQGAYGQCEPICDLELCMRQNGSCVKPDGKSPYSGASMGTMDIMVLVIILLSSVVVITVMILGVYTYTVRRNLADVRQDVRDILTRYAPLDAIPEDEPI